jgi:hypothetical protein
MSYAIIRAKQQAKAINGQFQDNAPVHWRELISLPMPSGIQMTMQDPQAAVVAADAAADAEQPQAPTGEYKDISRQQWNRNRKAIKDIQTELAAGQLQPTEAEVMLEMLGLSPANIKKLIGDTEDGTVDIPAEEFDTNE